MALAKEETNEARKQLDKALKDLHAARLEAEACRNETIAAKAQVCSSWISVGGIHVEMRFATQYAQAELTVSCLKAENGAGF